MSVNACISCNQVRMVKRRRGWLCYWLWRGGQWSILAGTQDFLSWRLLNLNFTQILTLVYRVARLVIWHFSGDFQYCTFLLLLRYVWCAALPVNFAINYLLHHRLVGNLDCPLWLLLHNEIWIVKNRFFFFGKHWQDWMLFGNSDSIVVKYFAPVGNKADFWDAARVWDKQVTIFV